MVSHPFPFAGALQVKWRETLLRYISKVILILKWVTVHSLENSTVNIFPLFGDIIIKLATCPGRNYFQKFLSWRMHNMKNALFCKYWQNAKYWNALSMKLAFSPLLQYRRNSPWEHFCRIFNRFNHYKRWSRSWKNIRLYCCRTDAIEVNFVCLTWGISVVECKLRMYYLKAQLYWILKKHCLGMSIIIITIFIRYGK